MMQPPVWRDTTNGRWATGRWPVAARRQDEPVVAGRQGETSPALEPRTIGLAGAPAMDLWTTPAPCPQPHSRHIGRSSEFFRVCKGEALRGSVRRGLLLVAVALAVADAVRFSRHATSSSPAPITFDVHLEDGGMVDEAIHGGERHSGIRKDADPVAEGLICRNHQAAAFVSGRDQLEQHRGLGLVLADVAEVLEDEQMVFVQLLDGTLE